jgi:hypothetical protein
MSDEFWYNLVRVGDDLRILILQSFTYLKVINEKYKNAACDYIYPGSS